MKAPYIIGVVLVLLGMFYFFDPYTPKGIGSVIVGMGVGFLLLGKIT